MIDYAQFIGSARVANEAIKPRVCLLHKTGEISSINNDTLFNLF
jgi:hypothetical protein